MNKLLLHTLAVTYNGSSLLLYADGELISTAVAAVETDSIPLFFGQKANGTGFYKIPGVNYAAGTTFTARPAKNFYYNQRLSFVIEQAGGGSSAAVTFYKDGTLVGTNTFSGVAANFAGGGGGLLGKNATGNYFSGLIDEVVFYNTLLSLPDIQLAANVGTNVTNKNLINFFPLNEGEGTSLRDYGLALLGKGTISGATFSTVAGITNAEHRPRSV